MTKPSTITRRSTTTHPSRFPLSEHSVTSQPTVMGQLCASATILPKRTVPFTWEPVTKPATSEECLLAFEDFLRSEPSPLKRVFLRHEFNDVLLPIAIEAPGPTITKRGGHYSSIKLCRFGDMPRDVNGEIVMRQWGEKGATYACRMLRNLKGV